MNTQAFPLERVGKLVSKVTVWNPPRDASGQRIRYVDLGSVDNESKVITGHQDILADEAPSRARQRVHTGDILVSTVRPNLNGVARVPSDLDGATVSTGFCVLRADNIQLSAEYLFHWVKGQAFVYEMVAKATGQSYPAVSDRIIFDSKIPLPPLDEQRRVAAILDQVDTVRRNRQEALGFLGRLETSIYIECIAENKADGNKVNYKPLSEVIKVRSGDGLTSANMDGGAFPVYGGNGVNGWHSTFTVPPGTIVIGRVGVYCGAVHITEESAWVTDNALIVTVLTDDVQTPFLVAALKHANLNQYAGKSAQPLVSGGRIYPVEIPVPAEQEQTLFSNKIEITRCLVPAFDGLDL